MLKAEEAFKKIKVAQRLCFFIVHEQRTGQLKTEAITAVSEEGTPSSE